MADAETWGERQRRVLTGFRERAKRTRTEAARIAGLEYWALQRLETGRSALKAEDIPMLADAYGVKPGDIAEPLGLTASSPPTEDDLAEIRTYLESEGLPEQHILELLEQAREVRPQRTRMAVARMAASLWRDAQRRPPTAH